MSVSVESQGGGRKSVDVEINLVPFIDMMSCMVAFLLLSAVWVDLAQIKVKPRGKSASAEQQDDKQVTLAVLVVRDGHYIGSSRPGGERRFVPSRGGERDWAGVQQAVSDLGAGTVGVE